MTGFGSKDLCGHVDFFPNGGEVQPNCEKSLLKNIRDEPSFFEGKIYFARLNALAPTLLPYD